MNAARYIPLAAALVALWLTVVGLHAQRSDAFPESRHHPAMRYGDTKPADVAAGVNARLERGELTLAFEPGGRGYLKSVLDAFGISPTSQALVYSQTSLQASYISAANPRAVYFNDDIAVAWVRGAPLLEVAAQDPRLGTVFYQLGQTEGPAPRFNRSETCLSCHLSWDTRAVPGVFVMSTFPRKSDRDYANGGLTDHREPLDRRWGGWYVTGSEGAAAAHGEHAADWPARGGAGADGAAAGVCDDGRCAGRARPRRLSDAAFRHRGAARARTSDARHEPDDTRRLGTSSGHACSAGRRAGRWPARAGAHAARARGRGRTGRLPVVRGRSAARHGAGRLGVHRVVLGAGAEGRVGTIAARAAAHRSADEVSAELHHLLEGVRGAAAGGASGHLLASVDGAVGAQARRRSTRT